MTIDLPDWLDESLKATAKDLGCMHTQLVLIHLVNATRPGGDHLQLHPRKPAPVPLMDAAGVPVPTRINGVEQPLRAELQRTGPPLPPVGGELPLQAVTTETTAAPIDPDDEAV